MNLRDEFKGKTVLITGHTGFKGGWLTAWLLKLGAIVIGYSRDVPTTPSFYQVNGIEKRIIDIKGDVNNSSKLKTVIYEYSPDYIFHLAAQAIVSKSYVDPLDTITTNILGTANLLDALRDYKTNTSVVMVTSDKSYKNKEWTWGYRENDEFGGSDIYSGSKSGAEMIINSYLKSFFNLATGVKIGVARAGNVIGGGDWSLDRIVPDCFRSWHSGKPLRIRSPEATRPWQHVLEPLSGYLTLAIKLAKEEDFHGEDFNFGPSFNSSSFPVKRLIADLYKQWPTKILDTPFTIEGGSFKEAGLLKLNCDKALHLLDWFPACTYEETISMVADWYHNFYQSSGDMMELTNAQIEFYEKLGFNRGCVWAGNE